MVQQMNSKDRESRVWLRVTSKFVVRNYQIYRMKVVAPSPSLRRKCVYNFGGRYTAFLKYCRRLATLDEYDKVRSSIREEGQRANWGITQPLWAEGLLSIPFFSFFFAFFVGALLSVKFAILPRVSSHPIKSVPWKNDQITALGYHPAKYFPIILKHPDLHTHTENQGPSTSFKGVILNFFSEKARRQY